MRPFVFVACALAAPSPAAAEGSIADIVGNGFRDGYHVGLGARAGASFEQGVYLGALFVYHVGETSSYTVLGRQVGSQVNVFYLGGEIGYDAPVGPFVLRPYGGIGLASLGGRAYVSGWGSSEERESRMYFAPGAAFLVPLGPSAVAGFDVRYVFITGDGGEDASALGMFVTAGVRF